MAVELAALEEVGERVLVDPVRAAVGEHLLARGRRRRSAAGHDQPAEPQRGRERLARRAGVDDAVGVEPLERADGGAVVAVLGVVVVLDRDRVVLAQPGEQRGAPLAATARRRSGAGGRG